MNDEIEVDGKKVTIFDNYSRVDYRYDGISSETVQKLQPELHAKICTAAKEYFAKKKAAELEAKRTSKTKQFADFESAVKKQVKDSKWILEFTELDKDCWGTPEVIIKAADNETVACHIMQFCYDTNRSAVIWRLTDNFKSYSDRGRNTRFKLLERAIERAIERNTENITIAESRKKYNAELTATIDASTATAKKHGFEFVLDSRSRYNEYILRKTLKQDEAKSNEISVTAKTQLNLENIHTVTIIGKLTLEQLAKLAKFVDELGIEESSRW